MICHYCQQPIAADRDEPRYYRGEPCCSPCDIVDGEV